MRVPLTRILPAAFVLFSLGWAAYTFIDVFVARTIGDCADAPCARVKELSVAMGLWRWLAIQILAVLSLVLLWERDV